MARRPTQIQEDESAGAPAWMTTFSDCMTLLLTFFVLLLSFSSFDAVALRRLFGALNVVASPSISSDYQRLDETMARREEPVVDRTDEGAEKPSAEENPNITWNPKHRMLAPERDAYCQEKRLRILVGELFLGEGRVLTQQGRDNLGKIAAFMRRVPCEVIVSELRPEAGRPARRRDVDRGLARAWVVMRFFTKQKPLSGSRFSISASSPSSASASVKEPCIQIVLLTEDVTQ